MKKVIFYAYRQWAIDLVNSVNHPFKCLIQNDEYAIIDQVKPDLVFFIGWSAIVPKHIIENYFCICLHPSPLPHYRGGSPIQHQIMNNEEYSAVTLFKMTEVLDGGPILKQYHISLNDDLIDIFERIKTFGQWGIESILKQTEEEMLGSLKKQNLSEGSLFKRRKPEQSEITLEEITSSTPLQLHNKIRALANPYPNAYIKCKDGAKLYLTKSKI